MTKKTKNKRFSQFLGQLVYVRWQDSLGCSAVWEKLGTAVADPLICESVGWLVHATNKAILVVPHLTREERDGIEKQGCGDMTIPAACILTMARLKTPGRSF